MNGLVNTANGCQYLSILEFASEVTSENVNQSRIENDQDAQQSASTEGETKENR